MRTAVVTGASSGIGRETALALAHQGFHVVAAGRSEARTLPVVKTIVSGGGSSEFVALDLSSLRATAAAARALSGRRIDVLVNNAGVGLARGVTADGFEVHFGVNHLGHFLLTELLGPSLATDARVVTVASDAHRRARGIDFGKVVGRTRSLLGWEEYGVSKLANILFSRELARRMPESRSYAVHPGLVDTAIIPGWVRPFVRRHMLPPAWGARPVVWCASSPDIAAETGLYYTQEGAKEPSPAAQDDDLAADLWERSSAWCQALLAG